MGKVYLIVQGWYENYHVVKAFSRREDAERYARTANDAIRGARGEYEMDVEDVDLD